MLKKNWSCKYILLYKYIKKTQPIKLIVFNVIERKNIMAYLLKHIGSWKKVFDYP